MFENLPKLHPALIHFPIALFLLAGVFGAISLFAKKEFWKDLAFKCVLVGSIFTPFAVLTGLMDEQNMEHATTDPMLSFHKYNGLALMFFYQILLVWFWLRKKLPGSKEYTAWVICLLLGSGSVSLQGYLGGEMVFTKGMGVKAVEEGGMGHGEGKMDMDHSSKTDSGHMENDNHDEGSMQDMKNMPGMDTAKSMEGMKGMEGMGNMKSKDNTKNMKGMEGMDNMKGNDNMKNMKGMEGMGTMKGKDNMEDMKGMDNIKGMKGMKNMKGMDNMKDMKGMKNMPGMDTAKGMKGMEGMDDMKDMEGMDGMKDMPGMKNMKGAKLIDPSKPYDNNPAREKKTVEKKKD